MSQLWRFMDLIIQQLLDGNRLPSDTFPRGDVNKVVDIYNRYRPLHLAAMYSKNKDMFAYLFQSGADINALDRSGNSPLSLAFKQNNMLLWEAYQEFKNAEVERLRETENKLNTALRHIEHLTTQNKNLLDQVEKLGASNNNLQGSFENLTNALRKKRKREHDDA